jgi:hypothetical protein
MKQNPTEFWKDFRDFLGVTNQTQNTERSDSEMEQQRKPSQRKRQQKDSIGTPKRQTKTIISSGDNRVSLSIDSLSDIGNRSIEDVLDDLERQIFEVMTQQSLETNEPPCSSTERHQEENIETKKAKRTRTVTPFNSKPSLTVRKQKPIQLPVHDDDDLVSPSEASGINDKLIPTLSFELENELPQSNNNKKKRKRTGMQTSSPLASHSNSELSMISIPDLEDLLSELGATTNSIFNSTL